MTTRSAAVRLQAEIDQYARDMDRAANVTANVGKAGERAAEQLTRAQKRQVDSAMSVRIAEERLNETRAKGSATASQILAAEQSVARAKDVSADATRAVTRAQDAQAKSTRESSSALGRLSASARDNREAWQQASVPLLTVGAGVTAMGVAALRTGVQYNTLQQTSRAALTTLLGSAEAANAQMDKLDEFARSSPFAKQTFITAQQQLLGFGMEASKVLPTLDAIQNAVAAFGGSNQQISEIAFILAQVQAAGKITATDLMQLGQRGVDAATLIGSQMGMTGAEIRESITAGTLDAGAALDALTAGMKERFGGAAANVKDTFVGSLDRVKAAWRELSAEIAEPFVGQQGGGVFTGLVNEAANLLNGFRDLPGAAKYSTLALGALTGAASLAAGGFLLMGPRIAETRRSINELAIDMPRTSAALDRTARSLGTLAKVAGATFTALAVYQTLKAIIPDSAVANVEKFQSALLDLSDGGSDKSLNQLFKVDNSNWSWLLAAKDGINGLDDAFKALDVSIGDRLSRLPSLGLFDNETDLAKKAFAQADAALTQFVSSGNLDKAAEQYSYIREAAEKAGYPVRDLAELFPQYSEALKGVENDQRLAGDSAEDMGGSVKKSAADIAAAEEAVQKAKSAWEGWAKSFNDVDATLSKNRGVQDWLKDLENQAKAAEEASQNMAKLALRGASDDLLAYLQEQGPAAAQLLDELANGSESALRRANKALGDFGTTGQAIGQILEGLPDQVETEFRTRGADMTVSEIANLAASYDALDARTVETLMRSLDYATPEIKAVLALMAEADTAKARPTVTADVQQARSAIGSVLRSLDNLPLFRQITIDTRSTRSGDDAGNAARAPGGYTGMRIPVGYAGGGRVPGTPPADPRRDNVLAMTQRGNPLLVRSREWIINEKQSEVNDQWLAAINGGLNLDDVFGAAKAQLLNGYAAGGRVEAADRLDTLRLRIRVRDLQRDLRETEEYGAKPKKGKRKRRLRLRGLDRVEAKYELEEARREYAETVRANTAARRARMSPERYNEFLEQRSQKREDLARDRRQASESFIGGVSIENLSSPASVERMLDRSIADMATLTDLLIKLKARGAAPWLLQQLQSAGPSKSAIKLARHYLADTAALRRVNARAASLQTIGDTYGQITADPRWMAARAWSGGLSSAQQRTLTQNVNLNVQTVADEAVARAVARYSKHELTSLATGAGIGA